jgi:hypothetical protein
MAAMPKNTGCTNEKSGKAGLSCNYFILVGARGFEPPTTWTPSKYATRLRYAPRARIIAEHIYYVARFEMKLVIKRAMF